MNCIICSHSLEDLNDDERVFSFRNPIGVEIQVHEDCLASTRDATPVELNNQPYRVDVVYDGALDETESFESLERAKEHLDSQVKDLMKNHQGTSWQVSIYDERSYPPELVLDASNEEVGQ